MCKAHEALNLRTQEEQTVRAILCYTATRGQPGLCRWQESALPDHGSFFSYFLQSSQSPAVSSPLGHLSVCTLTGVHGTPESLLPSGSKPQKEFAGNRILLAEYFYELQKKFSTENLPFYMPKSNTSVLIQCICKHSPIQ